MLFLCVYFLSLNFGPSPNYAVDVYVFECGSLSSHIHIHDSIWIDALWSARAIESVWTEDLARRHCSRFVNFNQNAHDFQRKRDNEHERQTKSAQNVWHECQQCVFSSHLLLARNHQRRQFGCILLVFFCLLLLLYTEHLKHKVRLLS